MNSYLGVIGHFDMRRLRRSAMVQRFDCGQTLTLLRYTVGMSLVLRRNGQMALVVNRVDLHENGSDLRYWLSRDPAERIAAVEVIRQRICGGSDEARQGLQRVCRIIRR